MADIRSVDPQEYNTKLAAHLHKSGDFVEPAWIAYVKSGSNKMRPIADPHFWYKRAAGILRQAYTKKVIGVNRLRTRYGGRKNNGMAPAHFRKSSGKIIRTILQQAEAAGLLEKSKGKHAGRQLTVKGRELLESIK